MYSVGYRDRGTPAPKPAAEVTLSPAEQVLAQLGRQKWAVDARDAEALRPLYTADSEHVLYRGGPEGRTELARSRGREEIIALSVKSIQQAREYTPGDAWPWK